MKITKSINRTIATIAGMKISFTVFLHDDEKKLIKEYVKNTPNGNKECSIYMDFYPIVNIALPQTFGSYDRQQNCVLTYKTKGLFVRGLTRALKTFERDDVFYMDSGKLSMYSLTNDMKTLIYNVGDKNRILIHPVIVEDKDGNSYEGSRIFFNRTSNFIELSYDELYSLRDIISDINFFLYSQALINYVGRNGLISSTGEESKRADKVKSVLDIFSPTDKINSIKHINEVRDAEKDRKDRTEKA